MPILQVAVVVLALFAIWLVIHIISLPPNLKQKFEFMYDHWSTYGWYVDSNNCRTDSVDGIIDAWLAMKAEELDYTSQELLTEILNRQNAQSIKETELELEHIRQQKIGGF